MRTTLRRRTLAALAVVAGTATLAAAGIGPAGAGQARQSSGSWEGVPEHGARFDRVATLPVYRNTSAAEHTAAEISAATADGRTVIYTDSPGKRVGFVDLSDVSRPKPAGVLAMPGEPTSIEILGKLALVAVNTSESFTNPAGRLVVVDLRTRAVVAERELGGQPDSIDISADGRYAAIAIENERDEDVNDGALPQLPAGFLAIVDLRGTPSAWPVRKVDLTGLAAVAPEDPEPEYVSINKRDQVVVTLQENNHLALVDLRSGRVTKHFSAGIGTATGVDTVEDGDIRLDGTVSKPREPDSVGWLDDRYAATADEGDLVGGSRTWTVFDTWTGKVVFSSGGQLDRLAARYGQYPENRAENAGVEPEGLAVATYGKQRYVFVGMERANLVAVYEVDDVRHPKLIQAMPTGVGPEGLLPLPVRDALVVSAEEDSAQDAVRSSVSAYKLRHDSFDRALERNAAAPTIVSAGRTPIGFGALSGLSAVPGERDEVVTITDNAYAPTRILTVDTGREPAVITRALTLTKEGQPVGYDAEGVAVRPGGGYWVAAEGNPGDDLANLLVEVDRAGRVVREVPLPDQVAAGATSNGFEGVTTIGRGGHEQVWLAVQREWADDPRGQVKLARYTPATGAWDFVRYPLQPAAPGTTVGLSEITALDNDTVLVLERDNQRGESAQLKKVYKVELGGIQPLPAGQPLPLVSKTAVLDLLPALRAGGGAVHDKPEGLAVVDGRLIGVVDNDGLDNAPGESILLRLGRAPRG